jgi:hypothetical protein
MTKNEDRKGILPQIIAAVVVALLAGGTSPWWWNEIFHNNHIVNPPNGHTPSNPLQQTEPISGGPIIVTATANPPVVSRGQNTTINVYVQDSQGRPLPFATVTLSSGGGRFNRTGTTTVSGPTDSSGAFDAYWSCDNCAPAYVSGVRVTKSGYEEAKAQWRVKIR